MQTSGRSMLLEARDVTVILTGDSGPVRVLDAISFAVASGEVIDITGPSGSGKTTLLRVLARLMPNSTGQLMLDGQPSEAVAAEQWRARVALLPQRPAVVAGDIRTNLTLPWRLKVRHGVEPPTTEALRSALDDLALDDVALERDVLRLSVGQQARIALLRTLLTSPNVLLLDEPDAALDHASAEAVQRALAQFAARGGGIIRSRHRGHDGLATRWFRLASGRLDEEGPK